MNLQQIHEYLYWNYPPLRELPRTRLEIWGRHKDVQSHGVYIPRTGKIRLWLGRDRKDQLVTLIHELAHHVADWNDATKDPHDQIWRTRYFDLISWMFAGEGNHIDTLDLLVSKHTYRKRRGWTDKYDHGIADSLCWEFLAWWQIPLQIELTSKAA